tara:strand:+ start:2340 stop:2663 length:324 start_codon:yes stop_codon:yes gene_type:complete
MKNTLLIVSSILLINLSTNALAANTSAKNRSVDVKCHVELASGKPLIYLANVKENQLNKLVDTLTNRKIFTPYDKKKQKVSQAFECVLMEAKFNSAKANELFDKQPR